MQTAKSAVNFLSIYIIVKSSMRQIEGENSENKFIKVENETAESLT